jgi:pyridoxamine 5'-phosphate oxidase
MSLADIRKDYSRMSLTEADLADDPIAQFSIWFEHARAAEIPEPNAMSLSTVAPDGRPSSRIVLIKNIDARGFDWFTNYDSQKGRELAANPYAALLFHWVELERQVRIEGKVERVPEAESEAYFNTRPLLSRLAAVASAQSTPVADRAALEQQLLEAGNIYGDKPVRPPHWGGYRLVPDRLEFWQGRRSRLHDRIVYTLEAGGAWRKQRLQP